ncbi:MAG: nitronate monooxygenase [Candidatus Dormiibacterota bacterium]
MLRVSGPDLVIAACRAGIIGAFPTANAESVQELDRWLHAIEAAASVSSDPQRAAPYAANLIVRQPRLADHLACLLDHRAEIVITSVGSPDAVVGALHDGGRLVFADVATLEHARKAIAAGVDGLVLVTAGAGGQTGWLNPLAFAAAVRPLFAGPIVLAGGIGDGRSVLAAQLLGCDLAYMGTKFIATRESMASPEYRDMVVRSTLDDVLLTSAFTGLPTNMLLPAIAAAGLDRDLLDEQVTPADADRMYGGRSRGPGPRRWRDVFSAGHSVSGVHAVSSVADVVALTALEYKHAYAEGLATVFSPRADDQAAADHRTAFIEEAG